MNHDLCERLIWIAQFMEDHGIGTGDEWHLTVRKAISEIERLQRGDFTEEEFQNLCHGFSQQDEERFRTGCLEYQKKLFGGKT